MRMHNGNIPQWMGRQYCLVSTMTINELAKQEARSSATTELVHFSSYIPVTATKGFLKDFCLTFNVTASAV